MSFLRFLVTACCVASPALASAAASIDSIPAGLPYVSSIRIEPVQSIPPPGRICPSDSIAVSVRGEFPNTCFKLRGVEVIEPPYGSPLPHPPIVRFVVDVECGGCLEVLTPWQARVVLPPLPPRAYEQPLQLARVTCRDSLAPDSTVFAGSVPFVVDACAESLRCVAGNWAPDGDGGNGCTAHVGPDHPARIAFTVSSDLPLAGLQGSFIVEPDDLAITHIETTGPAAGMHLSWRPTQAGARFNLFAEFGAPIPGDSVPPPDRHPEVPVLVLTLEPSSSKLARVTLVTARQLLGADEVGGAVPQCPLVATVVVAAQICAQTGCDYNGDGVADVRDLVLMAHCALSRDAEHLCPEVPDCNGDSTHTLEDVICCALNILRGPPCPGCPPDTGLARPAPDVGVELGPPAFTAAGAEIEVRVHDLGEVGGAVLRLGFPADRYDAALDLPQGDSDWLALSDVTGDIATIGLVRLTESAAQAAVPGALPPAKLRLTLKPGHVHGGAVTLEGAEFSASDGVRLETALPAVSVALGGTPKLALSAAQPNPFSGGTRFQLTLDRPAMVTVGIYDLGGRLVATLHRGSLPAGTHDFTWNGARDGGAPTRGGVYFYRVTAGTATAARKMVLLGD